MTRLPALCHWLLKVAQQILSCVQAQFWKGIIYMAAGVWAGARAGVSQDALTLDCFYSHPALACAAEGPHASPQVPDLNLLSSEWATSLHIGASCQLLSQVQSPGETRPLSLASELASDPVLHAGALPEWGFSLCSLTCLASAAGVGSAAAYWPAGGIRARVPQAVRVHLGLLQWRPQAEGGKLCRVLPFQQGEAGVLRSHERPTCPAHSKQPCLCPPRLGRGS